MGQEHRWPWWRTGRMLAVCALAAVLAVPMSSGHGATVAAAGSEYVSLPVPGRLADSRPGAFTVDGQFAGIGLQSADSTLDLQVAGRAGIPVDAPAVVLTVTAVDSLGTGFLTVHPTGTGRPTASNVNYYAAHNTAGTVIAKVGTGGNVSIYTSAATQLLVDVSGYLPAGSYTPLPTPARLADSRPGAPTIDGQAAGIGQRAAGSTLELQVAGRAGVPIDATVAVLNVAAVDPAGVGFLTVHPTGTTRPTASNVNFYPSHNMADSVVAKIGDDGKVSIYTSAATHLIVDVAGQFPASTYTSLPEPRRLADSRPGGTTIDGQQAGTDLVYGGHSMQLHVAGRGGVPADASVAVLTVTAVDSLGTGFATVHPNGTLRPTASNVNYYRSHNTANLVLARIGAGGDVCVFASAATQFIVDVSGYLSGPPPPGAGPTCEQPEEVGYLRTGQIWTMDADGTDQRPVVTDVYADSGPRWSPDGTKMAFIGFDDPPGAGVVNPNVWTADADGSGAFNVTQVFGGPNPRSVAWSPDGTQLAYITAGNGNLYVINADGTGNHVVVADGKNREDVDWSPDGSLLLFTALEKVGNNLTGKIEIWTIEPDGSNPTTLGPPGSFSGPRWSPDATEIAYAAYVFAPFPADDHADVWVMDADGTNRHNLTNDPTRFDRSPSWSPCGTDIIFDSAGPLKPVVDEFGNLLGFVNDPPAELKVVPATGGAATQLTNNAVTDQSPEWRPSVPC